MDSKGEDVQVEKLRDSGDVTPLEHVETVEWDPKEEKKLIRRIDRRLLPILGRLYAIASVDRVNVSAHG